MEIVTYVVFKAGVTVLQGNGADARGQLTAANRQETLLWLAAFLAGFRESFDNIIIRSLMGRLGGDRSSKLITTAALSTFNTRMSGLLSLLLAKAIAGQDTPAVRNNTMAQGPEAKPEKVEPATATTTDPHGMPQDGGIFHSMGTLDNVIRPTTKQSGQDLDVIARLSIPRDDNIRNRIIGTKSE